MKWWGNRLRLQAGVEFGWFDIDPVPENLLTEDQAQWDNRESVTIDQVWR